MAKTSKKKEWKPQSRPKLTFWEKSGIIGFVSFIPFFIFVLLPYLTRGYIVKNMKIGEEQLAAIPTKINLVRTDLEPAFFKLKINYLFVRVPRNLSPVSLTPNTVVFRQNPRRIARTLIFSCHPNAGQFFGASLGFYGFFMPSHPLEYLDLALKSDYQPVRQMCKASFLASQGIAGRIFEAEWDLQHRGYVFPNSSNNGYIGRIFCTDGNGLIEMALSDEVQPVTLRDWVNIGMTILPHANPTMATPPESLKLAMNMAVGDEREQNHVIEGCLNQYFATGSSAWVIPLAMTLEKRGFFREVLELSQGFAPQVRNDPALRLIWQELVDRMLGTMLNCELEVHPSRNLLRVKCKNRSNFALKKVNLRVTVDLPRGETDFPVVLFEESPLHGGFEKELEVSPTTLSDIKGGKNPRFRIDSVEVLD